MKQLPTELIAQLVDKNDIPSGGSARKVWWICLKGHKNYLAAVHNRSKGRGCPICAAIDSPKKKSITHAIRNPLSDVLRNQLVDKTVQISAGSGTKVSWRCSKGHIYKASPRDRSRGTGCSTCYKGTRILISAELQKELVDKGTIPSIGSRKNVEWECKMGHRWFARPSHRSKGSGCPECRQTKMPEFYVQQIVNNHHVSAYSNKKIEWECQCGHRWFAAPSDRVRHDSKTCPECSSKRKWSVGEREVGDFVVGLGYDIVRNTRQIIPPKELDIYIPLVNAAIEYNGIYWHSSNDAKQRDAEKAAACDANGISLLVIWDYEWSESGAKKYISEWLDCLSKQSVVI